MNGILLIIASLLFPTTVFAGEGSGVATADHFDLTHHIVGYLSIFFTVLAYVAAMSEDVIELRKSNRWSWERL